MDRQLTLDSVWINDLSSFLQNIFCYQNLQTWVTSLLIFLMPFSQLWPIGKSWALGVLPLYVTPGFYLSDIAVVLFIGLWLLRTQNRNSLPVEFSGAIIGLVLLAILTIPWALEPQLASYIAFRWLIAFLIYLWFAHCTISIKNILLICVCSLAIQASIGLIQVLHGALGLPGELIGKGGMPGRAYGLTFNPNVLGGYLAVGILLCIPLLRRWYIWGLWLTLWAGLLATVSRAAFFGTMLASTIAFIWVFYHYKKQRIFLLAACLITIYTVAFYDSAFLNQRMRNRLEQTQQQIVNLLSASSSSTESEATELTKYILPALGGLGKGRAIMIELALGIIQAKPLTGVGAGNFPLAMQGNQHIVKPLPHMYVHNVALLLASEVGIVGGGFWLLLSFSGLYFLIRYWHVHTIWTTAILCAWLAMAVISWFDSYPWALNSGRVLTVMLLGLSARQISESMEKQNAL